MRRAMLLAAAIAAAPVAAAADPLTFSGRIEAVHQAELSSQLNGVVAEILFSGGEQVEAGQPMIRLDPADARIEVALAKAALDGARADQAQAGQDAERVRTLRRRGIATPAEVERAEAALRRADADLAIAQIAVERAELALDRTIIRAPIAGVAGTPLIRTGAFLEAESGAPLGRIVALDPVRVAYRVPYATRLATLAETGAPNLGALFRRITVTVHLPDGSAFPHTGQPDYASATIDPQDGTVTVRAQIANPQAILRPGMDVDVRVRIAPVEAER